DLALRAVEIVPGGRRGEIVVEGGGLAPAGLDGGGDVGDVLGNGERIAAAIAARPGFELPGARAVKRELQRRQALHGDAPRGERAWPQRGLVLPGQQRPDLPDDDAA